MQEASVEVDDALKHIIRDFSDPDLVAEIRRAHGELRRLVGRLHAIRAPVQDRSLDLGGAPVDR